MNFIRNRVQFFLPLLVIVSFISLESTCVVFAQDVNTNVSERKVELQRQLDLIQRQIDSEQLVLDSTAKQRETLEGDVAILSAKIKRAKLSIQARDLTIKSLAEDIKSKEVTIGMFNGKIENGKESLAELIRKTNEIDSHSFVELVLSNKDISGFFEDIDAFNSIQSAMHDSFKILRSNVEKTRAEEEMLLNKKNEQLELQEIQKVEAARIQAQEKEKKRIVAESKGIEANYQKLIKQKQKNAAQIRSELFTLQGSSAISFERALTYATIASKKTGVRPAVILGIIAEESNLGQNVGTGNWRVDMKAPRDTVPFLDITKRLGLDPDKMPVSKKPWYGYGGAMGPAQFIPSTWVLYETRITKMTGHNPPNPWDPEDAFTATALLMADNGADAGTRASERLAALRYLAGWTNAKKPAYAFYGDDVMELADKYQKQIDILGAN